MARHVWKILYIISRCLQTSSCDIIRTLGSFIGKKTNHVSPTPDPRHPRLILQYIILSLNTNPHCTHLAFFSPQIMKPGTSFYPKGVFGSQIHISQLFLLMYLVAWGYKSFIACILWGPLKDIMLYYVTL